MTSEKSLIYMAASKFVRSQIGRPLFDASRGLWRFMPARLKETQPVRRYGALMQDLSKRRYDRKQSDWTCFLRNRAEIAYIAKLAEQVRTGGLYSVAVLGCSNGAEAYSAAYAMKESLERVEIRINASDIDPKLVEAGRTGVYTLESREAEHLSPAEISDLFTRDEGGSLRVRDRWRKPILWSVADATAPDLAARIGTHDLVLANKFLCHMPAEMARRCLANIIACVKPGGVLIVSGVDLDVRAEVTREAGLVPDIEPIAALHDGDWSLREAWPFDYWGLEPLDRTRRDWTYRYGVAFRKPADESDVRRAG